MSRTVKKPYKCYVCEVFHCPVTSAVGLVWILDKKLAIAVAFNIKFLEISQFEHSLIVEL